MEILDLASRARQSTQALTALSTCYMSRPCVRRLGRSGAALAGRGLLLEIRGERRRIGGRQPAAAAKPTFTLFALAEVRGQIGPCGCTRDPLGDISRTAKLVERRPRPRARCSSSTPGPCSTRKTPVPAAPRRAGGAQGRPARRRSTRTQLAGRRGRPRPGGPRRRARRSCGCRARRSNVDRRRRSRPSRRSVIDGRRREGRRVRRDRARRGRRASTIDRSGRGRQGGGRRRCASDGAQVVVALVQAPSKKDAVTLVRDIGGIDLAIAGLGARRARARARRGRGRRRSATAGSSIPANRGQVVAALDVTLRGAAARSSTRSARRGGQAKIAQLDEQLAALDADLAKFAAGQGRRPGVRRAEAGRARRARRRSASSSRRSRSSCPATGSYFTLEQVRINKTLACSAPVQRRDHGVLPRRRRGERQGRGRQAGAAAREGPGRATSATRRAATATPTRSTFWKTTRPRAARGRRSSIAASSSTTTASAATSPAGTSPAARTSRTTRRCATCSARPATARARSTSRRAARRSRSRSCATPPRSCARRSATPRSTPTRSSTTAYLRDIVGPGHGEDAAQEARRRPDRPRSCARPRSTRPAARSAPGACAEARLHRACSRSCRGVAACAAARRPTTGKPRRGAAAGVQHGLRDLVRRQAPRRTDGLGRALRQERDDRRASHAADEHARARDEQAQRPHRSIVRINDRGPYGKRPHHRSSRGRGAQARHDRRRRRAGDASRCCSERRDAADRAREARRSATAPIIALARRRRDGRRQASSACSAPTAPASRRCSSACSASSRTRAARACSACRRATHGARDPRSRRLHAGAGGVPRRA